MTDLNTDDKPLAEKIRMAEVAELLGGRQTLRKAPQNPLEAHEMLLRGLPAKALTYLVQNLVFLRWDASFEKAIGISQRTYQRNAATITKPLNPEQSGRTWKFAEILAKATAIFGSKAEAEQWLEQPATGLDRRRPIDLLATPAGVELVEDYLVRLEYGVYA
jgi:putative toxin-antitoxin system antitoxin component (TIGR02293 family)